jgi:cell division protein ZapA (FtsZ GTPase activity inhibitor)
MHLDRPEILAQVVERLQQEMREMREQLQLLENTLRGIVIGNAVAELGLRRAP